VASSNDDDDDDDDNNDNDVEDGGGCNNASVGRSKVQLPQHSSNTVMSCRTNSTVLRGSFAVFEIVIFALLGVDIFDVLVLPLFGVNCLMFERHHVFTCN
jgi:hypothetical protein